MNFQQLDQYLRAYDAIEKRQVLDHQNINDVQLQTRKDKIVMPDSPFLSRVIFSLVNIIVLPRCQSIRINLLS